MDDEDEMGSNQQRLREEIIYLNSIWRTEQKAKSDVAIQKTG